MNYQLSIIQFPSGRWGFVGSVPKTLAIRHRDKRELSDAEFDEYSKASNPSMVRKRCDYIEPIFNSHAEALNFAQDAGYLIPLITHEAFTGILEAITSNAARDSRQAKGRITHE